MLQAGIGTPVGRLHNNMNGQGGLDIVEQWRGREGDKTNIFESRVHRTY